MCIYSDQVDSPANGPSRTENPFNVNPAVVMVAPRFEKTWIGPVKELIPLLCHYLFIRRQCVHI